MKFRTKLFVGFAAILALLLLFSFFVLRMFFSMNQAMHGIVNDNYSTVKLANSVRSDINNLHMEISALLLRNRTDAEMNESAARIDQTKQELNDSLNQLEQMFESRPDERKLVKDLHKEHDSFVASMDKTLELLRLDEKEAAINWYNLHTEPIRITLYDDIKKFNSLQEQDMDDALSQSNDTYNFAIRLVIVLIVFTLLCGVIVATWVFRSVLDSLVRIIIVMEQASAANRDERLPRIEWATKDEMASIGHAYNAMAAALEEHARSQKQANLLLQEQNWIKSKVAEMTAMYQGVQTLTELAQVFVTAVAPAIGAGRAVLYLRSDEEDGASRLTKGGAYAASGRAGGEADGFAFGEGLVGQCAAENRLIRVSEPPSEYIRIESGLGSAAPAEVLIMPVPFEGQAVAVAEFASFQPFTQLHLELLEELTDILGITIHSISGHMQIQRLLGESQLFTEELQTQSEELQLQQEELRTLNEQLRDQIEASERKSAELEKIKNVLEEKNQHIMVASGYKTEFLTNMSHELRTPLNSLLILSQMLADNKEGNLNPKQVEYAQTIHSSGRDLLGLINEVLDLSKVEAGKLEVVRDWVMLRDIAEFAERQFEPIAVDKGLRFQVRLDEEIAGLMIYTDEQRLQQILQNLLVNAFKFTERGSVHMEMRMIPKEELAGPPAAPMGDFALAIAVADTGIGIPKDKQGIIFEAFRQADGTTSRRYGGTGLGLSICQKMAELLDGFIRVESEEGQGSTFTLYVPISQVRGELLASVLEAAAGLDFAESADAAPSAIDAALEGKKILLVDDDLRNIYALTTALEAYRIRVVFAENGQEGLQLLHEQSDIDLVLMDIMMPKMDGYEAIREIRKTARFQDLPIIALTAKAMKIDREKCLEAGASDYISKPILMDQLMSLIRVWLYK